MLEGVMMKSSLLNKEGYIFSTSTVSSSDSADEFVVELFENSPDQTCDGTPTKVIKNFSELIDFLELFDEYNTRID